MEAGGRYRSEKDEETLIGLPVFNEIRSVKIMIDSIRALGYSLIISDGGSTDGSSQTAKDMGVEVLHRPGGNKGAGLNQLLDYAYQNNYRYLVYMDCDQTYPVHRIPRLLEYRKEFDMVIGRRDKQNMTLKSKVLNFLINLIMNFLFKTHLKDTASGFRVLNVKSFYNKIKIDHIAVEFDLLGIAYANSFKIKEVDVEYYKRVGDSKLTLNELFKASRTLLKIIKMYKMKI